MEYIFEKNKIAALLEKLQPDTPARWGIMTAHHMVEHLGFPFVAFLNQKLQIPLLIPAEKVEKAQASLHDMTRELPKMLRPPFLPADELVPLRFSDLEMAKQKLISRIDDFNIFFDANPMATRMSPYFGELDRRHWELFQSKHFWHHFKQFGLVD